MDGPLGSTGSFRLALEVVAMLQHDLGAVVNGYDVQPGGAVTFDIAIAPASWRFRIASHSAVIERNDRFVHRIREAIVESRAFHRRVRGFLNEARAMEQERTSRRVHAG